MGGLRLFFVLAGVAAVGCGGREGATAVEGPGVGGGVVGGASTVPAPEGATPAVLREGSAAPAEGVSYPFGEGPTEVWSGDKVAGIAFQDGLQTDYYLFKDAYTPPTPGQDPCGSQGINAYPKTVSPWVPSLNDGAAEVTIRMLGKRVGQVCTPCGVDDCFGSLAAFESPTNGGMSLLKGRFGVADLPPFRHVRVTRADKGPFTKAKCEEWVSKAPSVASHQDQVQTKGTSPVVEGWQLVGRVSDTHEAGVTVRPDGDPSILALTLRDAPLPADADNDQHVWSEWCAMVDSQVDESTHTLWTLSLNVQTQ